MAINLHLIKRIACVTIVTRINRNKNIYYKWMARRRKDSLNLVLFRYFLLCGLLRGWLPPPLAFVIKHPRQYEFGISYNKKSTNDVTATLWHVTKYEKSRKLPKPVVFGHFFHSFTQNVYLWVIYNVRLDIFLMNNNWNKNKILLSASQVTKNKHFITPLLYKSI